MLFSSFTFLFAFLPATLVLYFAVPNRTWRNILLLMVSLLFYAWGEPRYILLIIVSIIMNFAFALVLGARCRGSAAARVWLTAAIAANLGLIAIFKYLDFGLTVLDTLLPIELPLSNLALPIGISFYTFQAISYIIDVYRGRVPAQRNVLKLGLYIAMFPQLIAGPIVRYDQIAAAIDERHESLAEAAAGIRRFVFGLAKKVLIANNAALIADTIYNQAAAATASGVGVAAATTTAAGAAAAATLPMAGMPESPLLWLAAFAYAIQIYFDFSGYSDMAIGLGHVFGFKYPENFDYPYAATSITGFWRRWHMSLTSWFRDYLYIPLGGNRVGRARWVLNMLIVWSLTGLWHGAAVNFIAWGLFFGILLIIERSIGLERLERIPAAVRWPVVMFCVLMGWVLFRVEGWATLTGVLQTMFTLPATALPTLDYSLTLALPWLVVAIAACFPQWRRTALRLTQRSPVVEGVGYLITILLYAACVVALVYSTYNPFIYFRF